MFEHLASSIIVLGFGSGYVILQDERNFVQIPKKHAAIRNSLSTSVLIPGLDNVYMGLPETIY